MDYGGHDAVAADIGDATDDVDDDDDDDDDDDVDDNNNYNTIETRRELTTAERRIREEEIEQLKNLQLGLEERIRRDGIVNQ